jgi:ATP-dependent DNA ligase
MLAKLTRELPGRDGGAQEEWLYEPKWDGFRCIAFRDGDEVELGSRNERPLTRYFPDVVAAARAHLPDRAVIDGEIVIAGAAGLDFDALSQRIHPAASRVATLARSTPASFVAFDLLALGDRDLRKEPFARRRALLVEALAGARPPVYLTPATADRGVAGDWFTRFEGAGLDGVVAKGAGLAYLEDQRAMHKVKHERTADFVVAGFRWYRAGGVGEKIGSLMLGLYDGEGRLAHVGVIGAFPAAERTDLVAVLAPYRAGAVRDHPWAGWAEAAGAGAGGGDAGLEAGASGAVLVASGAGRPRVGGGSRWNAGKDLSFELLRPELVVEAAYEHLQGQRLRHTARFRRWRPDRDPRSATFDQLEVAVPEELATVFSATGLVGGLGGDGLVGGAADGSGAQA